MLFQIHFFILVSGKVFTNLFNKLFKSCRYSPSVESIDKRLFKEPCMETGFAGF
jgi:hypothetical protein